MGKGGIFLQDRGRHGGQLEARAIGAAGRDIGSLESSGAGHGAGAVVGDTAADTGLEDIAERDGGRGGEEDEHGLHSNDYGNYR